jgi:hypothetical protein
MCTTTCECSGITVSLASSHPLHVLYNYVFHLPTGEELKAIPKAKERLEELAHTENSAVYKVKGLYEYPRCLEYKKFITKTHLEEGLPNILAAADVDDLVSELQPIVEEVILQSRCHHQNLTEEDSFHERLTAILNVTLVNLACKHPHLKAAQVDEKVRLEAFWARSGFKDHFNYTRQPKDVLEFFFQGEADFQVRSELPLPEVIELSL